MILGGVIKNNQIIWYLIFNIYKFYTQRKNVLLTKLKIKDVSQSYLVFKAS